jgi:hypothetical protein
MGFLSGRASFVRYQVEGPRPGLFGPEHLEKLSRHAIGRQRKANAEGIDAGWTAGEHILDTAFDLAKNVIADALHFALRIDRQTLPADLLRAYIHVDLQALSAKNPSGRPSARQKREARASARERLEAEAKDGRYLRRKAYPILWDGLSNELLVGGTSARVQELVQKQFAETFGYKLTRLDAGQRILRPGGRRRHASAPAGLRPSVFVPAMRMGEVAWVRDAGSHNYLGNEFLLWLWSQVEGESDSITLPDASEAAVMLANSLVLECPLAESGSETIRSDAPAGLPEAHRAIQAGKLPRRAGLILSRHGQQYELTLQAETLAVTGVKLPAPENREERQRREERIGQLRELLDLLDQLLLCFGQQRLAADWPKEVERIQRWLARDSRGRVPAAS